MLSSIVYVKYQYYSILVVTQLKYNLAKGKIIIQLTIRENETTTTTNNHPPTQNYVCVAQTSPEPISIGQLFSLFKRHVSHLEHTYFFQFNFTYFTSLVSGPGHFGNDKKKALMR